MTTEDNKIEDLENQTTSNVEEVSTVEVPEVKVEEAKPLSLDEALLKAFEKHVPSKEEEKPKTALPKSPEAKAEEAPAEDDGKVIDPITGRAAEPMKAPAGWTPALREKWGTIDPQVQKFIRDQEVGMARKLQDVSEERKIANEFKSTVAPYEAMLRQFNTTAKDHVGELLNMSYTLNTGSAQTKAQVIYNLIQHFKPDPQALQSLFAGQQPQAQQAQAPVNVQDEVKKTLAAEREAQQEQSIKDEITRFETDPKNEFFGDVRDLMSKVITAGLVEAPTTTELFRKAYDLACAQHPEVSKVLAGRVQQTAPAVQQAAPTRSVKPSLNGGGKSKIPVRSVSLDDAVAEGMKRAGLM